MSREIIGIIAEDPVAPSPSPPAPLPRSTGGEGRRQASRFQEVISPDALIAALGLAGTAWVWYTAKIEGYFHEKFSMATPAFLVLGLALVVFPGYREERIARGEDTSRLTGLQLLTWRWWLILAVSVIAGFGNYLLLRRNI